MSADNRFIATHTEGGLLPYDLLERIRAFDASLDGMTLESYNLDSKFDKLSDVVSRSWNPLKESWAAFAAERPADPTDAGTTLTRRWVMRFLREFGYPVLPVAQTSVVEGKSYPISHFHGLLPIHIVGCNVNIDKRTSGVPGAAKTPPFSLVQGFLNASEEHRWGVVTNGVKLRLLRDNASLTRVAFVEFDLEAMFTRDLYTEFQLLWLLLHVTSFGGDKPDNWRLERLSKQVQDMGVRMLKELRLGFEKAVTALGQGFLVEANTGLRQRLKSGELTKGDYYHQLLVLVYRIIFLLTAEERTVEAEGDGGKLSLIFKPDTADATRQVYLRHYSVTRLKEKARTIKGDNRFDLFISLSLVLNNLHKHGVPQLGLYPFGSTLWDPSSTPDLTDARLPNSALLEAVRVLCFVMRDKIERSVSYGELGTEELGSVYEGLLEQEPELNLHAMSFELKTYAGNMRKTSGSYYTPSPLVNSLVESALVPVIRDATKGLRAAEAAKRILKLKVCDPACGSGHFIIAAARKLAGYHATAKLDYDAPTPLEYKQSLREVVRHCIYGVDLNPMAVELCKVSLWLETIVPGVPLTFLDHHIKLGNSLIGATPALVSRGIPDEAFDFVAGDDKEACKLLKKANKQQRKPQQQLMFDAVQAEQAIDDLVALNDEITDLPENTVEDVAAKSALLGDVEANTRLRNKKLVADAWCAAFFWRKSLEPGVLEPITTGHLDMLKRDPASVSSARRAHIRMLASEYNFFHWHLEFLGVFRELHARQIKPDDPTGWLNGFDCVLGNPPWEHTELKEKEWFATRDSGVSEAGTGAARKQMIHDLQHCAPELYLEFQRELRFHNDVSKFLSSSGRFPLCGRGRINLYAVFSENNRSLLNGRGGFGCIIPSGIATDDTTKFFFQDLVENRSLISFYDFENRLKLFPDVDSRTKFALLTLTGRQRPCPQARFVFFALRVEDLNEDERVFTLTPEDMELLNPNTRTCPIFRSKRDAELTKHIYRRVPVLIREARDGRPEENPWGIRFKQGLFNMTSDSHLFRTREQMEDAGFELQGNIFVRGEERWLPLYEGKMVWHFDHRWANAGDDSPIDRTNPWHFAMPRYWVEEGEVRKHTQAHDWVVACRWVSNATNERAYVSAITPVCGYGNSAPIVTFKNLEVRSVNMWPTIASMFAFDYAVRQKLGGTNITFGVTHQLPWNSPIELPELLVFKMLKACLELTFTAWDLEPFARDCGYDGPPFIWDEERRFEIRCELDALFFHLYLGDEVEWRDKGSRELLAYFPTPRHAVEYMMETFPIVKRNDEKKWGTYRTKKRILEIFDEMARVFADNAAATAAGRTPTAQYRTRLDPPPGPPTDPDGNFIPMAHWDPNNWPKHVHRPRQ